MDSTTGTFRFSSSVAGTIYLDYVVSDGPSTATGVVRVDVVDVDPNGQPTAEDDVALLPAGGRTTVAVLDNDFDPAGGVLVVQSFSVKPDSGLTVEVLDREKLRISAAGGLKAQASFTYSVSNGSASATGTVVVIPLAAVPTSAPPVAEDDAATVRVGDLVTVHVMDNDTSPSGLPMSVESELQFSGTQAQGEAFVSQGTIRFKAGDQPGTVRVVYTLRDSQGNFDSAQVEIALHGPDGNSPPVARPLVARVLAGASSRIPVPLDMIDSDGDSVALLGVDTPPTKGTVKVGTSWLEYVAPAGTSGTDSFTYAVMDRYGARGIGTIHVGIAPPSPVNQPPTTVPDTVVARPDRQLSIAVLANDTDPDGDPLQLLDGSVKHVRRNAGPVLGASALVNAITALPVITVVTVALAGSWLRTTGVSSVIGSSAVSPLLGLAGTAYATLVLTGILSYAVAEAALGRRRHLETIWAAVRPRLWTILGSQALVLAAAVLPWALLVGMLALAARQSVPVLLLTGFGFGLLAVTANVVLLPRLLYAAPASVLEGLTLGRAFRRSWTLSRGRFWSLIGVLALVGALAVLVFWVTEFPQQLLYNLLVDMLELSPRVRDEAGSVTFALANLGSAIIVTPFLATNVVLHYLDARIRKEGFDLALIRAAAADAEARS